MILKLNKPQKGGFTLLELTIVLIIATILTSAVIPQLVNGYSIRAANKTALDIEAIGEASTSYYIKYNSWPGLVSGNAILDLTNGDYLPSSWQAINPFGFSSATPSNYSYNLAPLSSTPGAPLIISTYVPNANALTLIKNLLGASSIDATNNIVSASFSVPGIPPNVVPTGAILAYWGNAAPTGFFLCDGSSYPSSSYQNLANLLNAGSGADTFTVPDLRGRGIVGLNTLTADDGTSRVWSFDNYSDNQGQAAPYNVSTIGGIFGEEKHRQTLIELVPHTHNFASWDYVKGFSGNSTTSPRDPQTGTTQVQNGAYNDGTGLGAPANVVQPSMALVYIIKY